MSNVVKVNFMEDSGLFPWKKNVLLSGGCRGVLPFGIIETGEETRGFYRTEGFVRLSELAEIKADEILTVSERVLECVEICRDCLIFPGEYVLSTDTIYVTSDFREARIAYIPLKRYVSEEGALSSLIYNMRRLTTENGRTYLDTLGAMLECSHLKLRKVIGFIEELKEEIRLCGID